ncbi:alpha-keto acid decarboxylase family protein [Rosenbergiella collisarenosi]|uniref:alpha-keto acid decarboxylase family protein n=1 Tax=Rosenbergiella collisarenosi TaxID=1544695 RepID=UPI001BD9DE43|nr:thiamine pyrophosphate-binding protein [Rosenbergiella collisarenosi]MBT0721039.1 alpha-keto acid decarboxylase family protein [Rosenbergiella collisarenosi]
MQMQIGQFLIRRLHEIGIKHLFGVPGDFNLSFLEQLLSPSPIKFINNCNELNAAYAADGYARNNGIGAFLTTWGVGDLSALNGLAGAYAENIPVIHISGLPPLHAVNQRALLHHTLVDGDYDNIGRCVAEFTVGQTRITPANAVMEIDRLLQVCWLERRPVHLQLPSDITHLLIEVPVTPLILSEPASDPHQLARVVDRLTEHYRHAEKPVLLLDSDAYRFGVIDLVHALAEKLAIPYAVLPSAKGIANEHSPNYLGVYAGDASLPHVKACLHQSTCIIGIGLRLTDCNTGLFSQQLPVERLIEMRRFDVAIQGEEFPGVMLKQLLTALLCALPDNRAVAPLLSREKSVTPAADIAFSQAYFWEKIQDFLRPDDVIIGEAGTSHSGASSLRLPTGAHYISQIIWGSIGFTLPALLGSQLARPAQRHLLFIGDGSFQLTAQELSTILQQRLSPIIFLINNRGYTIERLILGARAPYNDVSDWHYTQLPAVFDKTQPTHCFIVDDELSLERALAAAEHRTGAVFIELRFEPLDAPPQLKLFAQRFAAFDYGQAGPRNLTTP